MKCPIEWCKEDRPTLQLMVNHLGYQHELTRAQAVPLIGEWKAPDA